MKSNRGIWGFVILIVLLTIAVSIETINSQNQGKASKIDDNGVNDSLSKYAVTDYDALESSDVGKNEERKLRNSRYDKQDWVLKNPHPDDSGVGRYDETDPPLLIPADDSDLIIVGKITDVNAYLSNDKQGVYSEFTIQADKILKKDVSKEFEQGKSITADRAGGAVRYSNGQKVIYQNSERALPHVGGEYMFFLTKDKISPNYIILTLYELKKTGVFQLDYVGNLDDFKTIDKQDFIDSVISKIAESNNKKNHRREQDEKK